MDKMESGKLSQKEYLRKYLSEKDDGAAKRKKKKKTKVGAKTVKIIDDDIDIRNMRPMADGEFNILNTTEDAPQIVGVIDERGPVDFADKRRWRIIADDGEGNVACDSNENYRSPDRPLTADSETRKSNNENGKRSKRKNPSPSRNASSDRDLSPPREIERSKSDAKRSKKKQRRESSSDSSSSDSSDRNDRRKSKQKKATSRRRQDSSPARSPKSRPARGSSESDQSPPRKRKNDRSVDKEEHSGRGKHRRNSDSDQSPPRRRKNSERNFGKNENGRREKNRGNSDSDQSPPRRRKNHEKSFDKNENSRREKNRGNSDSDLSPPRRSKNENPSKNRSRKLKGSDSDLSPPRQSKNRSRKSKGSDSDLSPPRAPKTTRGDSRNYRDERRRDSRNDGPGRRRDERSPRRSRWNEDDSRSSRTTESHGKRSGAGVEPKMKKTLDGKTAGLQDARALRIETEAHKKREAAMFKGMSAEVSGVGQAAVFRDRKTGRRRDLAAEAAETREKEKRQAEIDEKYAKWGKGLKQVDEQAEKRERDIYEMSKPLARYANDADLDKALREVEREGDTMLEEIKKRRVKEGKSEPARAVYQGSYAPNRFGIRPGHRWDGVDRSNGYEKKWFEARNARTALQEEAYKWSTADM